MFTSGTAMLNGFDANPLAQSDGVLLLLGSDDDGWESGGGWRQVAEALNLTARMTARLIWWAAVREAMARAERASASLTLARKVCMQRQAMLKKA